MNVYPSGKADCAVNPVTHTHTQEPLSMYIYIYMLLLGSVAIQYLLEAHMCLTFRVTSQERHQQQQKIEKKKKIGREKSEKREKSVNQSHTKKKKDDDGERVNTSMHEEKGGKSQAVFPRTPIQKKSRRKEG